MASVGEGDIGEGKHVLSEMNKKKTMENNGKSREVAVLQSKLLKIQWQADLIHLGLGKPWKKETED